MSLSGMPLLYVFFESRQLDRQRVLMESVLELPIVEIEPHQPHHRHGVVKYDAGDIILSLNLAGGAKFRRPGSDALVTVVGCDPESAAVRLARDPHVTASSRSLFTDSDGHHWELRPPSASRGPSPGPAVEELRLTVADLGASISFYRDQLGLELAEATQTRARFNTGSVPLVLEQSNEAVDGRPLRYQTYLLVFHADPIDEMRDALIRRGVTFTSPGIGSSDIGRTVRFEDPSGHRFCLYEPSAECLTWGSGAKVISIIHGAIPLRR